MLFCALTQKGLKTVFGDAIETILTLKKYTVEKIGSRCRNGCLVLWETSLLAKEIVYFSGQAYEMLQVIPRPLINNEVI